LDDLGVTRVELQQLFQQLLVGGDAQDLVVRVDFGKHIEEVSGLYDCVIVNLTDDLVVEEGHPQFTVEGDEGSLLGRVQFRLRFVILDQFGQDAPPDLPQLGRPSDFEVLGQHLGLSEGRVSGFGAFENLVNSLPPVGSGC
jgi:hypothetical protein